MRRLSSSLLFRKRPRFLIGYNASTDSASLSERLRNDVARSQEQSPTASTTPRIPSEAAHPRPEPHQLGQTYRQPSLVSGKVALSKLADMQDYIDELDRGTNVCANPQELRSAFLYWLSYDVRNTVMPNSSIPVQNAVKILQYVKSVEEKNEEPSSSIMEQVFIGSKSKVSPNLGICRLIGILLQPLQGTYAMMKHFGRRDQMNLPVPEILQFLQTATQVAQFLKDLHASAKYKFRPDTLSYQTQLNLIGKRCKFLTFILGKPPYDVRGRFAPRLRRGISWTDDATMYALNSCQRAKDCVEHAEAVLREMEQVGIPREKSHHSIFLSILADASRHDNGMADYAYAYVQQHFGEKTGEALPTAVYNPVLLAHCCEAERQRDDKQQVLYLTSQSEVILDQILPTQDPVTYSIMLKLYKATFQPEKAQQLFDRMYSAGCPPSTLHYNIVLDAYAKSGEADAAVQLFSRMGDSADAVSFTTVANALLRAANPVDWNVLKGILNLIEQQRQSPKSSPDVVTYTVFFDNMYQRLLQETDTEEKERLALLAEKLLKYSMEESEVFRAVVPHDHFHKFYNAAMRCWTATDSPNTISRSMGLLEDMIRADVRPNGTTYQCILVGAMGEATVELAVDLMRRMESQGIPRTATSTYAFVRILLDHVHRNIGKDGIEELGDFIADQLLDRLEASVQQEDCFTLPWIFQGFNVNMSKENDQSKRIHIAYVTEMTLRSLLRKIDGLESSKQLVRYFNESLKAWAFSLSPESASHAKRLMEELKERSIEPDDKTFEYALTSLSRLPDANSVQAARAIFQSMNDMKITITLSMLNTFLKILVRSNCAGATSEARALLAELEVKHKESSSTIVPNRTSYEILWRQSIQSKDCGRASELLFEMDNLGRAQVAPSPEMFLETIEAWSTSDEKDNMVHAMRCFEELAKRIKPTSSMYLVLQLAWCHSNHEDAASNVESILLRMQKSYDSGENPLCRPCLNNFRAVILSLTNTGETDRAEQVLVRLEQLSASEGMSDLAPNVGCYEDVLRGWAKSNDLDASGRAMALLDRMRSASCPVLPNQQCYTHAITTLKKSIKVNTANIAHDLLCEMIDQAKSGKNRSLQPTHETFCAVLEVCSSCFDNANAIDAATATMKNYVKLQRPAPRRDVYIKFLQVVFMVNDVERREQAVMDIFTDNEFACPLSILESPPIRDGLLQCLTVEGMARLATRLDTTPVYLGKGSL